MNQCHKGHKYRFLIPIYCTNFFLLKLGFVNNTHIFKASTILSNNSYNLCSFIKKYIFNCLILKNVKQRIMSKRQAYSDRKQISNLYYLIIYTKINKATIHKEYNIYFWLRFVLYMQGIFNLKCLFIEFVSPNLSQIYFCIPEIVNTNISHHLFDYKTTFVN